MTLSRRSFLFSLSAAGFSLCHAGGRPSAAPRLRFGVLSDSHVTSEPETADCLRRMFRRFAAENVDAVVHCGDICHLGKLDEFAHVVAAWREAFPGGKNAAGEPVVPFFVCGNHDYHRASFQKGEKLSAADEAAYMFYNRDEVYRQLTGEPFPGEVFSKTIKGHVFIGAQWSHERELADWLKAHPAPTDRPVFYVQHPHPKATCFGAWAAGSDHANEELMKHPNFWTMSGHSHLNVGCDLGLWQGGFVSMGAGSARLVGAGGFGGEADNANRRANEWKPGEFKHSPVVSGGGAWQGSVVSVYEDRVLVDRYDFRNDEQGETIGEAWSVDIPFCHDAKAPYRLADSARAPQFLPGAAFAFAKVTGKRRPDKAKEAQLRVEVPAARSDGDWSRPGFYRFTVREADGGKILERLIISDGTTNPEKRSATRPVRCCFAETELPKSVPLIFEVEPMNVAGKAGKAIVSEKYVLK